MIRAIPNQPVNFVGSVLKGCRCDELTPATLIAPSVDHLRFQTLIDICPSQTNLIDEPYFVGSDWRSTFWTREPGRACSTGPQWATLREENFNPIPGHSYMLRISRVEMVNVMTWQMGGVSGIMGTPDAPSTNTYTFIVNAVSTAGLTFTLSDGHPTTVCMSFVEVYELERDILVEVVSKAGDTLLSWTPDLDPEAFTFTGTHMLFDADIEGVEGCFFVRITENCVFVETVLVSQEFIAVGDTSCTVLVRACGPAVNFEDAPLEMRLNAKLVRPVWNYTVSEQRRSNGAIVRNYADRQTLYELRIGLQSEFVHPFISAIPLFPHFFIEQDEYVANVEGYEPGYADVFDGTGGIILKVRPKQELARYVACAEETAPCPPPPNYLVQGVGPNDDLILTQDGDAILLNN